jgi:GNAT superfamily N-acetyltransferase
MPSRGVRAPDYVEAHRAFVAVGADGHGGRVFGFCSLVLAPPELDPLFATDEAQGRGFGRLLVAHMQSRARAAGLDRVKVVSHLPAEDFYHRVGAVRCGPGPRSHTRPPCRGTVPNSGFAFRRPDAVCRFAEHRLVNRPGSDGGSIP